MSGRLLLGPWLVIVWVALSGRISVGNLVGGVLVSAVVLAVFPKSVPRAVTTGVRPLAALAFLGYFARKLVESNAVVAWEIITPGSRIRTGVIAVPLEGVSDSIATLIGNAITLTPGTLTLEAVRTERGVTLYVHVLHLRDIGVVRGDLQDLGRRAVRAFGGVQPPPAQTQGARS